MPSVKSKEIEQGTRRVFLRLFEDISEALNDAVDLRVSAGESQTAIAAKMGADKAFLSRVLNGQSGTNLRTIGAVLFATDCRLKVELVTCDQLVNERYSPTPQQKKRLRVHITTDQWSEESHVENLPVKVRMVTKTRTHVCESAQ